MADLVRVAGSPVRLSTTLQYQSNNGLFISKDNRVFNGPDGYQYRWKPSNNAYNDIVVRPPSVLRCIIFY